MIIHYCIVTVPKTENSIRTIALPENTVTLLMEEHSKHPDNPVEFDGFRSNLAVDIEQGKGTLKSLISESLFPLVQVVRLERTVSWSQTFE